MNGGSWCQFFHKSQGWMFIQQVMRNFVRNINQKCWSIPSLIIQIFISSITASCLVSCYCQLQNTCRYDLSLKNSPHKNKDLCNSLCPTMILSCVNSLSTYRGRCYSQSCSIWSTSTCMWLQPTASTYWGVTALHRPTEVTHTHTHTGSDRFSKQYLRQWVCCMQMVLSAGEVSVRSACSPSAASWLLFALCPLGHLLLWWDIFKTWNSI